MFCDCSEIIFLFLYSVPTSWHTHCTYLMAYTVPNSWHTLYLPHGILCEHEGVGMNHLKGVLIHYQQTVGLAFLANLRLDCSLEKKKTLKKQSGNNAYYGLPGFQVNQFHVSTAWALLRTRIHRIQDGQCCGAGPILTGSGSGYRLWLRITTFL